MLLIDVVQGERSRNVCSYGFVAVYCDTLLEVNDNLANIFPSRQREAFFSTGINIGTIEINIFTHCFMNLIAEVEAGSSPLESIVIWTPRLL